MLIVYKKVAKIPVVAKNPGRFLEMDIIFNFWCGQHGYIPFFLLIPVLLITDTHLSARGSRISHPCPVHLSLQS